MAVRDAHGDTRGRQLGRGKRSSARSDACLRAYSASPSLSMISLFSPSVCTAAAFMVMRNRNLSSSASDPSIGARARPYRGANPLLRMICVHTAV